MKISTVLRNPDGQKAVFARDLEGTYSLWEFNTPTPKPAQRALTREQCATLTADLMLGGHLPQYGEAWGDMIELLTEDEQITIMGGVREARVNIPVVVASPPPPRTKEDAPAKKARRKT